MPYGCYDGGGDKVASLDFQGSILGFLWLLCRKIPEGILAKRESQVGATPAART